MPVRPNGGNAMLMTKQINLSLLVICSTLFVGCATPTKYQISEGVTSTKSSFELIDSRDEVQKTSHLLSSTATNCFYGIFRIGDEQIVPSRLTILSNALEESMGHKLQGKKVIVNRFEILNNLQKPLREMAAADKNSDAELLLALISEMIISDACKDTLAFEKNPNNDPAIVVIVDIDVDGVNIKDKIVQIEPEGIWNPYSYAKNHLILTERVKRAVFASIKKVVEMAPK
jgi:hypothetical protein